MFFVKEPFLIECDLMRKSKSFTGVHQIVQALAGGLCRSCAAGAKFMSDPRQKAYKFQTWRQAAAPAKGGNMAKDGNLVMATCLEAS